MLAGIVWVSCPGAEKPVSSGGRCSYMGFRTSLLVDQVNVAVSVIAEFMVIVWLELNPV